MLDSKIQDALNRQINHEITAAYNYLAMAAYCEEQRFAGFGNWLRQQRLEELAHAMRLFDYLLSRGGAIELAAVTKPKRDFNSLQELFAEALKQEKINTDAINELYSLAVELKDYTTQSALQWFLDEQVEEEKTMNELLALLRLAGDDQSAITRKVKLVRSFRVMVTTDKPLYQPGQLIHIRSLSLANADMRPVAGRKTVIEVQDAKGNKVFKEIGKTSGFGIFVSGGARMWSPAKRINGAGFTGKPCCHSE